MIQKERLLNPDLLLSHRKSNHPSEVKRQLPEAWDDWRVSAKSRARPRRRSRRRCLFGGRSDPQNESVSRPPFPRAGDRRDDEAICTRDGRCRRRTDRDQASIEAGSGAETA